MRERKKQKGSGIWTKPAVILALFGTISVFITALLNPDLVGKFLDYLQRSSVPAVKVDAEGINKTATLPPVQDTSTIIPTMTVTLTPTPFPLPGEDWAGNCINVSVWKPYLAGASKSGGNSCYDLSNWGIIANQGSLGFATNQSKLSAYEYGIFTPWQQNWTEVDFSVNIKDLNNSELWFGFFAGDPPSSTGIVFVIQPNDTVDVREMPSENAIVNNVGLPFAGGKFDPKITFEGGKFALWIDGQGILSNWPINFTIRNMFIGYRTLPVVNLDAIIYDLKFK